MPTITSTPLPAYGWVRVTTNWTDRPWVTAVQVERVDVATGVATPLRPHTSFSGWYQGLSGGTALVYDTEAPLDVPFYYQARGLEDDAAVFAQMASGGYVSDLFERTVGPPGWGTATSGQVWASATGSTFSVLGTMGRAAVEAKNVRRLTNVGTGLRDVDVVVRIQAPALAAGGPATVGVMARWTADSDYYWGEITFQPDQTMRLRVQKRVAGVETNLSGDQVLPLTHSTGAWYWLQLRAGGGRLSARAWRDGTAPPAWSAEDDVYDSSLTAAGAVGVRAFLDNAMSNTLPYNINFDHFSAGSLSATSAVQRTLVSNGGFWLRSPLRPYKDRRVTLRPAPGCPPVGGVFFAAMDPRETYSANATSVAPANRSLATSITRPRRGLTGALSLVTRTFADRDAVLDTLSDGTALQWAAPPEYGIPLRYLAVADVDVTRGLSDHRFQARVMGLPFTQVSQPAGPAAGVTGARWRDLCATYATWDAAATAGVTYDAMVTVS